MSKLRALYFSIAILFVSSSLCFSQGLSVTPIQKKILKTLNDDLEATREWGMSWAFDHKGNLQEQFSSEGKGSVLFYPIAKFIRIAAIYDDGRSTNSKESYWIQLICAKGTECIFSNKAYSNPIWRLGRGEIHFSSREATEKVCTELNKLAGLKGDTHGNCVAQVSNWRDQNLDNLDDYSRSLSSSNSSSRSGDFSVWPNMPKNEGSRNMWQASCTDGGYAWVNVQHDQPNVYCWGGGGFNGAGAGCDAGIGVEAALAKACRGE